MHARDDHVSSPCIGICELAADGGLCRGCLRSVDEIAAWSRLTPEARRSVLRRVAERRRRAADAAG